ncbi:MAG: hypothetical protein PHC34_11590 [Candidatus Gastranaerophilales bacterium]|nr:hypothetical protein [Candidatus Gastranaerophilales bacterium]
MKLIYCSNCHDVVRLMENRRFCECKNIWGRYVDNLYAEISEQAIPIGFENSSFYNAIKNRPKEGMGIKFNAFSIPEKCKTITVVKDKDSIPPEEAWLFENKEALESVKRGLDDAAAGRLSKFEESLEEFDELYKDLS